MLEWLGNVNTHSAVGIPSENILGARLSLNILNKSQHEQSELFAVEIVENPTTETPVEQT